MICYYLMFWCILVRELLFEQTTPSPDLQSTASNHSGQHSLFHSLDIQLVAAIRSFLSDNNGGVGSSGNLAAALSVALCWIHQNQNRTSKLSGLAWNADTYPLTLKTRILVLTASNDVASHYISFMNCIFSAQKSVSNLPGISY